MPLCASMLPCHYTYLGPFGTYTTLIACILFFSGSRDLFLPFKYLSLSRRKLYHVATCPHLVCYHISKLPTDLTKLEC